MPEIKQENLTRLLRAERLLYALQEVGVEEWENYDEAYQIAFPEESEKDEDAA